MMFRTGQFSKFTIWIIAIMFITVLACLGIWLWFNHEQKAIDRQIDRTAISAIFGHN